MHSFSMEVWLVLAGLCMAGVLAAAHALAVGMRNEKYRRDMAARVGALRARLIREQKEAMEREIIEVDEVAEQPPEARAA